jgi:anti-anti-sigma factor
MNVKTDTKEKFHVITIRETELSANMTEPLKECLLNILQKDVKNVVLNIKDVENLDNAAAETIVRLQQQFYEQNYSFVVCELTPQVEKLLDQTGLLELLNYTPTESEAGDIVQMEEIERDLLNEEGE